MKVVILLISSLFISSFSQAGEPPVVNPAPGPNLPEMENWDLVMRSNSETRTQIGCEIMQEQNPEVMMDLDCSQVSQASTGAQYFAYSGPTNCEAGDPALRAKLTFFSYCEIAPSSGDIGGLCLSNIVHRLNPADPCGGDTAPPMDSTPIEPN